MSFIENPFKAFNLRVCEHDDCATPEDKHECILYHGTCDSCGNEKIGTLHSEDAIYRFVDAVKDHVLKSHRSTPDDFKGWH